MSTQMIKTAVLSAIVSATFLSSAAYADVTITFPDTVDLLSVNTEKPNISSGLFSSEKSVTLTDGLNQIVFRYEPTFDRGNNVYRFTSETIIASFDASNTSLEMVMPKYRNENMAKAFDQDVNWILVDQHGRAIETKQDKLTYDGLQIGRNYSAESIAYNQKGGIAAIAIAGAPVVYSTTPNQAAAAAPVVSSNGETYQTTSEQMLHYWYNQADEGSRARFLEAVQAK